jgi:hypothetical protein
MRTIKLADQDIIRKVTAEHRLPSLSVLGEIARAGVA